MKKNKILYILTIIITLFTFNMNTDAEDKAKENSDASIMCIYDIGGNKVDNKTLKTIILKQNVKKEFSLYTHESKSDVAEYGWEIGKINKITYNGTEVASVLGACPKSISVSINIHTDYIGGTGYGAANQSQTTIVKTEKYEIALNDSEPVDGSYGLNQEEMNRNMEPNTNININPEQKWEYDAPNAGDSYSQGGDNSNKVSTLTSGTTCNNISEEILKSLDNTAENLATCYYGYDVVGEGCHLIAVSHLKSGGVGVRTIDPSYITTTYFNDTYQGADLLDFSPLHQAVIDNDGWCLTKLWVYRGTMQTGSTTRIAVDAFNRDNYKRYSKFYVTGVNLIDQTKLQSEYSGNGEFSEIIFHDCASIFNDESSKKILEMIKIVVNLVKIGIPILLIGLGILDFAKAIFQGKEDDMKKAQDKFIKRIIIGVCLFLVPTILKFILTIGNSVWGDVISVDFCGIL